METGQGVHMAQHGTRRGKYDLQRCRALMREVVSDDDWKKLFTALLEQVTGGGGSALVNAAQLLLKYQFGVPTQPVAGGDAEAEPIRIVEVHLDGADAVRTWADGTSADDGAVPPQGTDAGVAE